MKYLSPTTIIVPNILHTVHLGMIKHLMDWVTSFLEQHSRIDKFPPALRDDASISWLRSIQQAMCNGTAARDVSRAG
jgi:hypothetical protein